MPVKQRQSKHRDYRITPAVVEAFQAGDYDTVIRLLVSGRGNSRPRSSSTSTRRHPTKRPRGPHRGRVRSRSAGCSTRRQGGAPMPLKNAPQSAASRPMPRPSRG